MLPPLAEPINEDNLYLFVQLHDVGKVSIPREILGKRDQLTSEEWEIMKSHSEIGFRMAESIGETTVAKAILSLRERWDGKGYPQGIKGKQTPIMARMFAIIEAFDVMTNERPYRSTLSKEEAVEELLKNKGTQFDQSLRLGMLINPGHLCGD
jgi:HD-GYP domain-containing protein (c-di-GMP phosphodiesterase class II)